MPDNTSQCYQGGGQGQQGSALAKDLECNKVIKVIIWCNVHFGVVFSPHIDPNSVATRGGQAAEIHTGPEMKSRYFDAAVTIRIIRGPVYNYLSYIQKPNLN